MIETITLKDNSRIKSIVTAAFPGYKKHKAFVSTFTHLGINSYWDGGSKSEFVLLHVPTLRRHPLPTSTHPFYDVAVRGIQGSNDMLEVDSRGNMTLKALPAAFVIVEAGTFCGKPSTAHVHFPPALAIATSGFGGSTCE